MRRQRRKTASRPRAASKVAEAKFIYEIEKRVNATCTLLANCYRTPPLFNSKCTQASKKVVQNKERILLLCSDTLKMTRILTKIPLYLHESKKLNSLL